MFACVKGTTKMLNKHIAVDRQHFNNLKWPRQKQNNYHHK